MNATEMQSSTISLAMHVGYCDANNSYWPSNLSYTLMQTKVQTLISVAETKIITNVVTTAIIDDTPSETLITSEIIVHSTYFVTVVDTYILPFLEDEPVKSDAKSSNISPATLILLFTFGCICVFSIAVIGMFLYRNNKHAQESDSDLSSSSIDELSDSMIFTVTTASNVMEMSLI